jgi:hypothetical protein
MRLVFAFITLSLLACGRHPEWTGLAWRSCGPADGPATSVQVSRAGLACGSLANDGLTFTIDAAPLIAGVEHPAFGTWRPSDGGAAQSNSGSIVLHSDGAGGLTGELRLEVDGGTPFTGAFEAVFCPARDEARCG